MIESAVSSNEIAAPRVVIESAVSSNEIAAPRVTIESAPSSNGAETCALFATALAVLLARIS